MGVVMSAAMGGLVVQPLATFRGIRHVPLLAASRNSLFPSLEIGADAVRIRVVGSQLLRYAELEAVQLRRGLGHRLLFVPKTGIWTFSATFAGAGDAMRALAALRAGGAPLDAAALAALDGTR